MKENKIASLAKFTNYCYNYLCWLDRYLCFEYIYANNINEK